MKKLKRRIMFAALAAILFTGAFAWHVYRPGRMSQALNPFYWMRRWRGDDLYGYPQALLMHGNRKFKEVAITIDDGPRQPTGGQILDLLRESGVRATFFVVGEKMKKNPDLVRRMVAEGHEVANHTQTHLRLDTLTAGQVRNEINNANINFERITGRRMNLLRPPGVRYNDDVLRIARENGYVTVSWSIGAHDFDSVSADYIYRKVMGQAENGSIVLLHDYYPSTVQALSRLIPALKKRGYRFVTVSEMLARLPRPVAVERNPLQKVTSLR